MSKNCPKAVLFQFSTKSAFLCAKHCKKPRLGAEKPLKFGTFAHYKIIWKIRKILKRVTSITAGR